MARSHGSEFFVYFALLTIHELHEHDKEFHEKRVRDKTCDFIDNLHAIILCQGRRFGEIPDVVRRAETLLSDPERAVSSRKARQQLGAFLVHSMEPVLNGDWGELPIVRAPARPSARTGLQRGDVGLVHASPNPVWTAAIVLVSCGIATVIIGWLVQTSFGASVRASLIASMICVAVSAMAIAALTPRSWPGSRL
jgi:hypothetical protein